MNLDPKFHDRLRARIPDVIGDLRSKAAEHAPESLAAREAGYSIRNADGAEAVVRIYDEIWWLGINADDIARDLDAITAPAIRVEINSPGGDVWDGVAIYNALRNHPARVTTRIDGMAASIASVIFQAGDHRVVHASSQMMIHNAWGYTVGDHRDHADMVDILRNQDRVIAGIYAAHGANDADHYQSLMDAETWMVGQDIIDQGLADEIVEPHQAAANAAPRKFAEHAETVITDLAEFVTRTEEVVTFRANQGKEPIAADTVDLIARIRGEADRLAALTEPDTKAPDDPELADLYARLYARQQARPQPQGV